MHFTYEPPDKSSLQQGDLIRRTPAVDALLKEVHPHYSQKSDYKYLAVLTQTCDLVRRGGTCSTRYISLAAVRPLRTVVQRMVEDLQYEELEQRLGFCDSSRQAKLVASMERLLNNNEPDYFFYYREPNFNLDGDHCAFLQLSIAVKAPLHYDTLLGGKLLQLREPFQHKLGHIAGTMYSRVGTEDWLPDQCSPEVWQKLCRTPLEDEELVLWIEKDVHAKVLRELKRHEAPDDEVLRDIIQQATSTKVAQREKILEIIGDTFADLGVDPDIVLKARARLENNSDFRAKVK